MDREVYEVEIVKAAGVAAKDPRLNKNMDAPLLRAVADAAADLSMATTKNGILELESARLEPPVPASLSSFLRGLAYLAVDGTDPVLLARIAASEVLKEPDPAHTIAKAVLSIAVLDIQAGEPLRLVARSAQSLLPEGWARTEDEEAAELLHGALLELEPAFIQAVLIRALDADIARQRWLWTPRNAPRSTATSPRPAWRTLEQRWTVASALPRRPSRCSRSSTRPSSTGP